MISTSCISSSRVIDDDHHAIVLLDQSFRSEQLILLYSNIQIHTKALHYIPAFPQFSLLLKDEEELLLESFRNIDKPYIPKEKRNDLEFMRKAIQINCKIYQHYEIVMNDREATLSAVSQDGLLLQKALKFLSDFQIVYQAFKQNPNSRQYAGWSVHSLLAITQEYKDWNDEIIKSRTEFTTSFRRDLLKRVAENPVSIWDYVEGYESKAFKERLNENAEIMMECIKVSPSVFKYAHQLLRSNKEFVLEALSYSGLSLDYVDISLMDDLDVIKTALRQNIYASKILSENLKTRELLLEFPHAIEYFPTFKSNLEIMMHIVKVDGKLLQYAESTLQSNRNLVLEAVKQCGLSIQYANPILIKDREIALAAITQNGNSILYIYKYYSNDSEIMEKAMETNGNYLKYCSIELRRNKQMVIKAISKNGNALRYAPLQFQKDKEIVLMALKNNSLATEFIHSSLWKEEEIVKACGMHSARALYLTTPEIKCNKEVVFPILCKYVAAYDYMDHSLRQDEEFLLNAIGRNWRIFEKIENKFRNNEEFIRKALQLNDRCFGFLDEKFKNRPEFVIMACGSNSDYLFDFLKNNRQYRKDIDFIEKCVVRNAKSLSHFDLDLLDDHHAMKIVKLALKGAN